MYGKNSPTRLLCQADSESLVPPWEQASARRSIQRNELRGGGRVGRGQIDSSERRSHLSSATLEMISDLGARTVTEIPCGRVDATQLSGLAKYFGGDPDRLVVASNRATLPRKTARFGQINLLYDRPSRSDLLICADLLEWLSHREAMQVLANLLACRSSFICMSTHPELLTNWDTALGDYRPLNLSRKPFNFPTPLKTISAHNGLRSDRCLSVWAKQDLLAERRRMRSL